VTPGANQKGLVKSETEPDLAGAISQLGLSGLSARPRPARARFACVTRSLHVASVRLAAPVPKHAKQARRLMRSPPASASASERRGRAVQALGALSVDVLFGDFVHVQSLALLPSLQRITGVPAAAAAVTGLPQPIMSQLRVTGGLGTSSPHSFASVAFQPTEVNGMLQARRPGRRPRAHAEARSGGGLTAAAARAQVTATALTSLDSFAQLQARPSRSAPPFPLAWPPARPGAPEWGVRQQSALLISAERPACVTQCVCDGCWARRRWRAT